MTEAVAGQPGSLPLLQFAAAKLWEQRDQTKRMLVRSAYRQMGGVEGALAQHADGSLDSMSAKEQSVAREILLRLVTPEAPGGSSRRRTRSMDSGRTGRAFFPASPRRV